MNAVTDRKSSDRRISNEGAMTSARSGMPDTGRDTGRSGHPDTSRTGVSDQGNGNSCCIYVHPFYSFI
jgi:hypothetical protein